jgi:hypothetical protein
MQRVLSENWDRPIVAHNAGFDVGIAMFRLGLPAPTDVHDTEIQSFLLNPFSERLGLKDLAREMLSREPVEQKALDEWVVENVGCTPNQAGRYYAFAPDALLLPYARADVEMLRELDRHRRCSNSECGLIEAVWKRWSANGSTSVRAYGSGSGTTSGLPTSTSKVPHR